VASAANHTGLEARHEPTTGASDRRLVRLGFDLHDGPLQDIAVLAGDLRLLRTQLAAAPADIVRGRIDDALALVASIESDVRDLSGSLQLTKLLERPLEELVRADVEQAEADGIRVALLVSGDVDACTASQRIALYRIVQESLWNVRHHSGADSATVRVVAHATALCAEVADDGHGFDVDRARREGASARRLGLAGMHERVRLLGGSFTVESRAGGPTTVRAVIPRWRPDQAAAMPQLKA
jgi:signal transduction histidine kinase